MSRGKVEICGCLLTAADRAVLRLLLTDARATQRRFLARSLRISEEAAKKRLARLCIRIDVKASTGLLNWIMINSRELEQTLQVRNADESRGTSTIPDLVGELSHEWHVPSLFVAVLWPRVDGTDQIILEDRVVQSHRDIITHYSYTHYFDFADEPRSVVLYGGILAAWTRWKSDKSRTFEVTFPEYLKRGDRTRFAMLHRQRASNASRGDFEFVLTPVDRRIDAFTLRVSFPRMAPTSIWKIDGVPEAERPGNPPREGQLQLNEVNEVAYSARDRPLAKGCSYGLAWRFDDSQS